MAKKRQQDFNKTKLKPGRPIGKRRNVTKTSFQTKKIAISTKKSSSRNSELTMADCLKCLKGTFTASRVAAMQNLKRVVENQEESFLPFLAEVLEILAKLFLDSDQNIRNFASEIMCSIFAKSSGSEIFKMKISSFVPLLTNIISCGMNHTALNVKQNALTILSCILMHCPDLICKSFIILKNLLNLIVAPPRKSSQLQSLKSRSSLSTICDNTIISDNWRIGVLKTMNMFLKEMLRNIETDVEEDRDEQEVYWNAEGPLYLEIFDGGGLKPIDIEKCVGNSPELEHEDPSVIEDFILPLVNLIPEIFLGEIAGKKKGEDCTFPVATIRNLNILFQVLYHLTEWIQLMPCEEMEKFVTNFLLRNIYGQNLFPFHPSGIFNSKNQSPEAAELNLTMCFLHGKFLLQAEECDNDYAISTISYIKSLFQMSFEIKFNSILMLIKILKMYYSLSHIDHVSEFIVHCLCNMSNLLQNISEGQNKDALVSHFMKLSLQPAYDFLTGTDAMRNWFNWLLIQLLNIPSSGEVNKNLLSITKKIANRKYPHFLESLASIDDNKYKVLLKYDNPLVRDTVIFLIYNMQDIKASLFEDISNVILLDTSFPVIYAIRLIRLLTCRYTEKCGLPDTDVDYIITFKRGRMDFITFLINIAIDSLNVTNEKLLDYDTNSYTKAMEPFKDVTTYNVIPSLKWKEHSKLFQVCQKSLNLLPKKLVDNISTGLFQEILENNKNLPMHCVIAMMKLNKWEMRDNTTYYYLIDSLVFSSLLTSSILTRMSLPDDEWFLYNTFELVNSIELRRTMALRTLSDQLDQIENADDDIEPMAVYHILRIIVFYLDKGLFKPQDGETVRNILEGYKEKCSDKSIERQPLYQRLFDIFNYYT